MDKVKKGYKDYKAKEPERRKKKLADLTYKTNVAKKEAQLMKAQRAKEKYAPKKKTINSPGFSMGFSSDFDKGKKKKKKETSYFGESVFK